MNYSVEWRDVAERALLAAIGRAADKPAFWAVARAIDRRLELDPENEGESRAENVRLLFVRPFSVLFQFDSESRTVIVEELKWVGH